MDNSTLRLIQKLRKKTGMGILTCKNALTFSNGNFDSAVAHIRKLNQTKNFQRFVDSSREGMVYLRINRHQTQGVVLEVNSKTDFVSKNPRFRSFCRKTADFILRKNIYDLRLLKTCMEEDRVALMSQFDEYVDIRRFTQLQGECISSYLHGTRIGVLVSTNASCDPNLVQKIAMHIASNNPHYLDVDSIPSKILAQERNIQQSFLNTSSKPNAIREQILKGRMKKFVDRITLMNQPFVFDCKTTVGQIAQDNGIAIDRFVRFEMGEET